MVDISIHVSFLKHAESCANLGIQRRLKERDLVLTLEKLCLEGKLVNNWNTKIEEIEAQKWKLLMLPEGIREGFPEAFALSLNG